MDITLNTILLTVIYPYSSNVEKNPLCSDCRKKISRLKIKIMILYGYNLPILKTQINNSTYEISEEIIFIENTSLAKFSYFSLLSLYFAPSRIAYWDIQGLQSL